MAYPKPTLIDHGMLSNFKKGGPRAEATLWRLVKAASETPPSKALAVQDVMREIINNRVSQALGQFGLWLNVAFVQRAGHKVSTADVWAAWAAFNEANPEGKKIGDVSRSKDLTRRIFKLKAAQVGQIWQPGVGKTRGYSGWECPPVGHCSVCAEISRERDLVDLSMVSENVRLSGQRKCHLNCSRWYQVTPF